MSFDERLGWLLLGGLIGFILGYIVRSLREIKEEVDEMGRHIKEENEEGLARHPVILDVVLLIVVVITAWASFQTAVVNSRLNHTVDCITQYNIHQGEAVRTRDKAIQDGTRSEIRLWTQYGRLYALAKNDPSKIPAAQERMRRAIDAHRSSLMDIQANREAFPYAGPNVLENCKDEE